jgi:ankyrin repeat protein
VQLLGGSCEKATRDGRQTGNFGPPEIRREMVRQRATGVEQELFQAVSDGNAERVSAMLASAWPVNRKSEVVVGGTVLLWAAYCDRPQIVSLLIAHGADLNLPSDQGSTPLIEAAKMGHAEVVGVLLAAGADANRQTGKGWTALMWSVEGGHAAVVRMLLNAGAGIEVRNNRGETALDIATRLRRDELRAILQSRSTQ